MRFKKELVEGAFVKRVNRFSVVVRLRNREIEAHLANSGRLRELLVEGRPSYLYPVFSQGRKTSHDLLLMKTELGVLVSVDARHPNTLFEEAFREMKLAPFARYHHIRREVVVGASRLDFQLTGPEGRCFVEVKSITLVDGNVGLFPDGRTVRGVRHLRELAQLREGGDRAGIVFLVQRSDVDCVMPNDEADSPFGAVLREVVSRGVEVYAYRCRVGVKSVTLENSIHVVLD